MVDDAGALLQPRCAAAGGRLGPCLASGLREQASCQAPKAAPHGSCDGLLEIKVVWILGVGLRRLSKLLALCCLRQLLLWHRRWLRAGLLWLLTLRGRAALEGG